MIKKNKIHVLVSGAGIAGLCTAYWLIKYGFKVTIVERASHIRSGGQALDVRGPALEVADRMGILGILRDNSTKLKGMSVVDALSGKEIFSSNDRTATGGRLDSADVEILRDDLCRVLFEAIGNQAEYLFDNTIASINQNDTGVNVTFANSPARRFDLVLGADGLRSNVRRLVFGADNQFIRYLGYYVAIFTTPNFLNLDHWEIIYQNNDTPVAASIVKEKEGDARTYLGFSSELPLDYDYRDIKAQKQLVADRTAPIGKDIPKIIEYMQHSPNFYFDSVNQIIMDKWSKGLVSLVGDAGYSVSISLGQGTTVAMVGAYVLAGELAAHQHDLKAGLLSYEKELRAYVEINQQQAYAVSTEPASGALENPDNIRDLGQAVIPFTFR